MASFRLHLAFFRFQLAVPSVVLFSLQVALPWAGYIPDGCAGPLCFEPDDVCCFDLIQSRGWEYVCGLRYERWKAARIVTLAKSLPPPLDTIGQRVAEFSVDVDGEYMPFCLDEPSSSRGAPQPASETGVQEIASATEDAVP